MTTGILKKIAFAAFCLLILLAALEKDLFIRREIILWNINPKPSWDDFRGYPNYLCSFDAAINSHFTYRILNDSVDSIRVETIMFPHHSWVKNKDEQWDHTLRHEQVHFRISEIIARKFRKELCLYPKKSLNKKKIRHLYYGYMEELDHVQKKYDKDTDHSLRIERQKDWEYLTDSLLNEYSYYSSPRIRFKKEKENNREFFRAIDLDAHHRITGRFPIDSVTAASTRYYRFFYSQNKISRIEFRDRNKLSPDHFFEVSSIDFRYMQECEYRIYRDETGQNCKNSDSVFVTRLERKGKELIIDNLDSTEKPAYNKYGVCRTIWTLDHKNRKLNGSFYNHKNERILTSEGYYTLQNRYDKNDNIIENANYDAKNQLSDLKNGVALYRYFYDEMDNLSVIQSYNKNHYLHPFDGQIATVRYHYDLNGNIIRQSFRKKNGAPFLVNDRIAVSYYEYDRFSNLTGEKHYGLNKNLIISEDKTGRIERDYDSLGRITEIRNFDAYDEYLNDISQKCKVNYTYASGFLSEEKQFSVDSVNTVYFLKTIRYTYENNGKVVKKCFLNEEGAPLPDSNGVCCQKLIYDNQNNLIALENYDNSGRLHPGEDQVSVFRYKYDNRNNKIETAYFDSGNNPFGTKKNIAIERYKYNSKNLMIEKSCYDAENNLTKNEDGIELIRWDYDEKGNVIKESFYDKKGLLIPDNYGVSFYLYDYDSANNKTGMRCFNSASNPVVAENSGVAAIRFKYSENNELIETSYYDYQDLLIDLPEGYAIEKDTYNSNQKIVKREYFSKFKKPVVTTYGYASVEWKYDWNENVIAEIYRDEIDELIEDSKGYAVYNWIYDRNAEPLEVYGFKKEYGVLNKINKGPFMETVAGIYSNYRYYSGNDTRLLTTYYPNGQKHTEVMYIEGKLEGTYTEYYESGVPQNEIEYHEGNRHGKSTEYFENGQKSREAEYQNNIYVATSETTWYENGKLRSEYQNGKLIEWDREGNIISD